MQGVGLAFFPTDDNQTVKDIFNSVLDLNKCLTNISQVEEMQVNGEKSIHSSKIAVKQVIDATRLYCKEAQEKSPEAFKDKTIREWTIRKLNAVAGEPV